MNREDWDRRYARAELVWSAEPNRFLVEQVASLTPGRALDVATGEGRNAVWLAERGWSVDAVDFSGVALDKARRRAAGRGAVLNWIEADVERYHVPERVYGLVILLYLHLPWERMRGVLRRAAAGVAPQGTFLLVGHDRTNLDRGHGGPKSADVLYTSAQVARELPGLRIEEAERRDRPVETDDGTRSAIDCLVRATRPRRRPDRDPGRGGPSEC